MANMGLSIKNNDVEVLVRAYAKGQGIGVTEAIARAVRIAQHSERVEKTELTRKQAVKRFLKIAKRGWKSTDQWDRDEMHTR